MKFLEKVIVSVLSTIILSLSLAFFEYTATAKREAGVGYFSFNGLFMIYFIYSLPIYLVGGGFYSYLADVYLDKIQFRNKFLKYIIEFLLYVVGGLLIIGIILAMLLLDEGIWELKIYTTFIFGTLASLLFFHVSLVLRKTLKFIVR